MSIEKSTRTSRSFRISTTLLQQLQEFVRDNRGKPLYLEVSGFIEEAIRHHIARTQEQLAEVERAQIESITAQIRRQGRSG